jgi:putative hydrolase of the HAD superfamily
MPDTLAAQVRWILFDAVGTLIYPDPPVAEVYYTAARHFGSQLSVEEVARRFRLALASEHSADASGGETLSRPPTCESFERNRWRRIVGQVIDDVDPAAGDSVFQQLWMHFADPRHWRLFGDVEPALADLANRGYRLGIASNFDGRLKQIIRRHPELRLCQDVFVSSEVGFIKPDPRFFSAVICQLGVAADQVLLVGDDEVNDALGGRAAGWQAVQLDRGCPVPVAKVISTLRSLAELLGPQGVHLPANVPGTES